MPRYTADLHNHSPLVRSDYRDLDATPERLAEAAADAGIEVLGLTDHFAIGYVARLAAAARDLTERSGRPLLVLPGCEMKVAWGDDEVHLVALLPPHSAEETFAALMADLGVADRLDDVDGLPFVKVERDPVEVVRLVDGLGGLCHVGHVDRRFGTYRLMGTCLLDRLLTAAPLSAVEVLEETSADILRHLAPNVTFIRSSDAHSPSDMGRRTTELEMNELSFEGLREALLGARPRETSAS